MPGCVPGVLDYLGPAITARNRIFGYTRPSQPNFVAETGKMRFENQAYKSVCRLKSSIRPVNEALMRSMIEVIRVSGPQFASAIGTGIVPDGKN